MGLGDDSEREGRASTGRLVLPALFTSTVASYPTAIVVTVLLTEIGATFGTPVGVMGQIRTVSSTVSLIIALLMGVLSVRFGHKTLLMMGLAIVALSALGCGLAPSFGVMLASYALAGLGVTIVTPMVTTLVAENFPLEKRSGAIGWIGAGGGITHIIGSALIGSIATLGGWRPAFLGYALPLSALGLMLAAKGLPSTQHRPRTAQGGSMAGFKGVLSNRSAVACLVGTVFASASWQGLYFFTVSFMKQRFLMPINMAAMVYSGMSLGFTLGSLTSGRFVNRFGRKPITVFGIITMSLCTIAATNSPHLWLSVAVSLMGPFWGAFRNTGSSSLILEQVPEYRGTAMSVRQAALMLGTALGTGIGGLILLRYDWQMLGMALGAMGFVAAGIYHLLVTDPTIERR